MPRPLVFDANLSNTHAQQFFFFQMVEWGPRKLGARGCSPHSPPLNPALTRLRMRAGARGPMRDPTRMRNPVPAPAKGTLPVLLKLSIGCWPARGEQCVARVAKSCQRVLCGIRIVKQCHSLSISLFPLTLGSSRLWPLYRVSRLSSSVLRTKLKKTMKNAWLPLLNPDKGLA